MSDDIATEFWDRAGAVTAGMLSAEGALPRPMAHTIRPNDPALWFITAKGTDICDAAEQSANAQYILACGHSHLYATVDGSMTIVMDRERLDEIWSPMAAAWFEDGREDDDIRLVKFTPREAEIWLTDGGAKTMYELTKALMSDEMPDVGQHGKVHF